MKKLYIVQFDIDLHQAENYKPTKHRVSLAVTEPTADDALLTAEASLRAMMMPTYSYEYVGTYQPERA